LAVGLRLNPLRELTASTYPELDLRGGPRRGREKKGGKGKEGKDTTLMHTDRRH